MLLDTYKASEYAVFEFFVHEIYTFGFASYRFARVQSYYFTPHHISCQIVHRCPNTGVLLAVIGSELSKPCHKAIYFSKAKLGSYFGCTNCWKWHSLINHYTRPQSDQNLKFLANLYSERFLVVICCYVYL